LLYQKGAIDLVLTIGIGSIVSHQQIIVALQEVIGQWPEQIRVTIRNNPLLIISITPTSSVSPW